MTFASNTFDTFMRRAYAAALKSPDPSTQNGAVVFDPNSLEPYGVGCNRFTTGVDVRQKPEILERPLKYTWIEHAERNAIYDVVRSRLRMPREATMVAVWASCADCARAIVQSGVRVLVRHAEFGERRDEANNRWAASVATGDEILHAGGVRIIDWRGPVDAEPILRDSMLWDPRALTLTEIP